MQLEVLEITLPVNDAHDKSGSMTNAEHPITQAQNAFRAQQDFQRLLSQILGGNEPETAPSKPSDFFALLTRKTAETRTVTLNYRVNCECGLYTGTLRRQVDADSPLKDGDTVTDIYVDDQVIS